MSLKCDQTICLPRYLFSRSLEAGWSLGIRLQMGTDPTCVVFCLVVRWKTLWTCARFYFVMGTFCFNASNYHSTTVSLYGTLFFFERENAESLNLKCIPACVALKPLASMGEWSSLHKETRRRRWSAASCLKQFARKGTLFPLHLVLGLFGEKVLFIKIFC